MKHNIRQEILYVLNDVDKISIISDNTRFMFLYDKLLKKSYVRTHQFTLGCRANQHFWTIVGNIIRKFKADSNYALLKCEWDHSSKKVKYSVPHLTRRDYEKCIEPLIKKYDNPSHNEFRLRHTKEAGLVYFSSMQQFSKVKLHNNQVDNVVIENNIATVYFAGKTPNISYDLSKVDVIKLDYYIPSQGRVIDILLGIRPKKDTSTLPITEEINWTKLTNQLIKPIDLAGKDLSFLTEPVSKTPLNDLLKPKIDYEAVFYKLLRIISDEGSYRLLIDEIGDNQPEDFIEVKDIGLNVENKKVCVSCDDEFIRQGSFEEILPLLKLSKLDYIHIDII